MKLEETFNNKIEELKNEVEKLKVILHDLENDNPTSMFKRDLKELKIA